jgi:hypothetical protein
LAPFFQTTVDIQNAQSRKNPNGFFLETNLTLMEEDLSAKWALAQQEKKRLASSKRELLGVLSSRAVNDEAQVTWHQENLHMAKKFHNDLTEKEIEKLRVHIFIAALVLFDLCNRPLYSSLKKNIVGFGVKNVNFAARWVD